jgi:uncharacterized protein DUF5907
MQLGLARTLTAGTYELALNDSVLICNTSAGNVVINLPAASFGTVAHSPGRLHVNSYFLVKASVANSVIINAQPGDTINGLATLTMSNLFTYRLLGTDGVNAWFTLAELVSEDSTLIGRGSAAGAGEQQEISLGAGLTMTGKVLSAEGGGSVPDASTTVKGIVELATDGEVAALLVPQANDSRLSDDRFPTAHSHSAVDLPDATTTTKGIVELATSGESAASLVPQANDARLSDARTPLAHSHTAPDLPAATTTSSGIVELATDGESAANLVPQANDARLSNARTPLAHSHVEGDLPDATTTAQGVVELATDGESAANLAVQANDARLSNARTPTAHATSHQPGGGDAMAVDAAAGTGSLRTLGSGATQAAGGTDARLSDARTPLAHATSHKSGGSDAIKLDELAAPTDVTILNATTSAHGLMPKGTGSTSTFYRSDMTQAIPSAVAGDLDKPETGSLTVATAKYHMAGVRHQATTTQRITVAGTGRLRIFN